MLAVSRLLLMQHLCTHVGASFKKLQQGRVLKPVQCFDNKFGLWAKSQAGLVSCLEPRKNTALLLL